MKEGQITPEFLQTLGQAVLDFGFMESVLRNVIIVLSRNETLTKALVPPGNPVSENIELLRRLCYHRVHPSVVGVWLAALDEIQKLFEERNKIFHGIFFESEAKLFLAKTRKGKRGAADEWNQNEFDIQQLPLILNRLSDRRRQFMDFVDDYSKSDDGPPHTPSQETHPSLSIGAP